jgi:predicted Zn-dependent protease
VPLRIAAKEFLAAGTLPTALAAIAVHSGTMLAVTAAMAGVVYEWMGLAFLRRGWINLDRIWIAVLTATGLILIV